MAAPHEPGQLPAHTCGVCGEAFPSKNKLFKHLKGGGGCGGPARAGAAAAAAQPPPDKRPRLAAAAAPCGRVQVSIASLDSDVEPDACLLPEKLRLIRLAGIEPDAPVTICGCACSHGGQGRAGAGSCGDATGAIPRDLLRALRVLAMTETELYFAGGPEVGAWAASECRGMSVRNEIRALNHLRKLVRANDASYKAKRVCRQGLLDLVARMTAEVYAQHLPAETGGQIKDDAQRVVCQRFEQWSKDAGISSSLCVRDFASTGRGMAAVANLQHGQVILATQAGVFLNTAALAKSRFAHVFSAVKGLDERAQHILLLLMEYGALETSPWKAYLEACPVAFDNALTLSLEEIQELQGSPALDALLQHRQDAENLFSALFPAVSDAFPKELPPPVRSWERFVWAAALIDTRAWATEAGSDVSSLVPVADMLNHHVCAQGEVQRFREEEGEVRVQLLTDVKQGQQVYVFYGALSTASQLVRFGFCDEDNPHDTVPFELDLSELTDAHSAAMQAWDLRPDTQQLLARHTGPSWRLISMLRILHLAADGADAECLARIADKAVNPREKLSDSNEKQVGTTLKGLLETISAGYPTPLEADIERSTGDKKATLSAGLRACLSHLISQKRIVRSNLERIQNVFSL